VRDSEACKIVPGARGSSMKTNLIVLTDERNSGHYRGAFVAAPTPISGDDSCQ